MKENVQSVFLICNHSPRKAFYNLIVTGRHVLKVSGETVPKRRVLDKRVLPFKNNAMAVKFFEKKVREKRRAGRKRVYSIVPD